MVNLIKLRTRDEIYRDSTVADGSKNEEEELTSNPVFAYFIRPSVVEFFGTLIYTFLSVLSFLPAVIPQSRSSPDQLNLEQTDNANLSRIPELSDFFAAFSLALTQGVSVYFLMLSMGHISGGHFNPVITIAVWLGGGIQFVLVCFYLVAQLFGGFIGALLVRSIMNRKTFTSILLSYNDFNQDLATKGQAVLFELILTFLIVLVFLLTVVDTKGTNPLQAASTVGTVLFIATLVAYPITSSGFNPARSVGVASAYSIFGVEDINRLWEFHWIYWIGPILGSLIAAVFYRLFAANAEKRLVLKE